MSGPAQKTAIEPMLSVRNGAKAVEFYTAAFGADTLFRIGEGNEAIVAQMSAGGAIFWVTDESPEHSNFQPGDAWRQHGSTGDDCGRSGCRVRPGSRGGSERRMAGCRSALPLARGTSGRSLWAPLGDREAAALTRSKNTKYRASLLWATVASARNYNGY